MATRCGRLDPGVLLYLAAQGHSQADIEHMLYHQSGLLGVSGISGDIRVLLASESPYAKEPPWRVPYVTPPWRLGPKNIRANAISPGAIRTRAASGIAHFDELLAAEAAATPDRDLVSIEDVGALAAFLVSDGGRRITGTIISVDGGQHAIA